MPIVLPIELHAKVGRLELVFPEPIDPKSIDSERIEIQTWSLKRTEKYGSKHYDEKSLKVQSTRLSEDGKTVSIPIDQLSPTWSMEIKFNFRTVSGQSATGVIHNTIHHLRE